METISKPRQNLDQDKKDGHQGELEVACHCGNSTRYMAAEDVRWGLAYFHCHKIPCIRLHQELDLDE